MFVFLQVPVSTPVSMAPYAIPVCAGPHLPVCTGAHHPVCSTAPTWSIPGCSVQLPSCNMQHIPACSLPQIPFHPSSIPPLFHHHHHPATSHIPPQHLAPPTHFNPSARGVHVRRVFLLFIKCLRNINELMIMVLIMAFSPIQ